MVAKATTKAGEFFCFHCGKQVAREDNDCRGCGSSFDRMVQAFRCPRCARILPVGAVVCPACGLGFKIKNVSGTKQLTKDDELLVELIDWGKQPEAPAPPESPTNGGSQEKRPYEASREAPPEAAEAQPATEMIRPPDAASKNAGRQDEMLAHKSAPGLRTKSHERAIRANRVDTEVIDISQAPMRRFGDREAPIAQEPSPPQSDPRRGGLSNQILKKMLEEREREVLSLRGREEEIARREAHLEKRIREYAAKRRELDNLRMQAASADHPTHHDHLDGDAADPLDFPSQLAVDDREGWLRDQSRIKMGLIEIRNELGSRDDAMDYYPPNTSTEVLAKMEALEEKIMDLSRDREELSARLKKMEASSADTRELLRILDQLLGRLPPETIEEFSKSKEFKLYQKVLDDLNI